VTRCVRRENPENVSGFFNIEDKKPLVHGREAGALARDKKVECQREAPDKAEYPEGPLKRVLFDRSANGPDAEQYDG